MSEDNTIVSNPMANTGIFLDNSNRIDENDRYDDMIDMETGTFGLPLKNGPSRSNFAELSDATIATTNNGWMSFPGSRSISPVPPDNGNILSTKPKRVRFTGDDSFLDDDTRSSNNSSRSGLTRRSTSAMSNFSSTSRNNSFSQSKRNVEQLLFTTSELNAYVAKNQENIKAYRNNIMNNDSFYNSMSNISSPVASSKTGSMSNFVLSDLEDAGEDDIDDTVEYNRISMSPISGISANTFMGRRSPINLELSTQVEKLENDDDLNKAILDCVERQQHDMESHSHEKCELLSCTCFPLIDDKLISSTDLIANTIEESINNFIESITIILQLSQQKQQQQEETNENKELLPHEHRKFLMKNAPSLSYQDFIKRIQSKCELNPTIYMCATYLLQSLFMGKDKDLKLRLKRTMNDNGIHRLIIALIRVSCKLLEDQLYSHEYISKVCGVSKRLLTQLESCLLICLKNQNLMITIKKLNASVAILTEMRTLLPHPT